MEFIKTFITRTIEQIQKDIENMDPPKRMIGDLIYQYEQTILFSATNLGKSILATQIALAVARGENLDLGNNIILENEAEPTNTIYFDFELSDQQFIKRISGVESLDNLHFSKIERGALLQGTPRQIFDIIKEEAESVEAKFIIIDNISKIGNRIEETERAIEFMSPLFDLCRHFGYTILIMAHTPKRNRKDPITSDSMSGSSKISQLCDSIIGINEIESEVENTRVYIKQIKSRNGARKYGESNVICTEIIDSDKGGVEHEAFDLSTEHSALTGSSSKLESKRQIVATKFYTDDSNEKIGKKFGKTKQAIGKTISLYKEQDPEGYQELLDYKTNNRDALSNIVQNGDTELPF